MNASERGLVTTLIRWAAGLPNAIGNHVNDQAATTAARALARRASPVPDPVNPDDVDLAAGPVYTLTQVRDGTGWPPGVRFRVVRDLPAAPHPDGDPCKCMTSHAAVSPAHPGHCCFVPATQVCHPEQFDAWLRADAAVRYADGRRQR